jgi:hypothetical protein
MLYGQMSFVDNVIPAEWNLKKNVIFAKFLYKNDVFWAEVAAFKKCNVIWAEWHLEKNVILAKNNIGIMPFGHKFHYPKSVMSFGQNAIWKVCHFGKMSFR